MELRHLRYFVAVAEELHFGRAAEKLRIAQPPLSQQIKQLEEQLQVVLFDRSSRRVRLTAAGTAFLARARSILETSERAIIEARRAGRGETGSLTIGFMSAAMLDQFPPLLRRFRQAHSDVDIEFRQMPSNEQVQAVIGDDLDVGFVDLSSQSGLVMGNAPTLRIELFARETLVAALPPDHPLADRQEISLRDLAEDRFIMLPRLPATSFYDQVTALCQRAGFDPAVIKEAPQLPTLLTMVASGIGVALAPECVIDLWQRFVRFPCLQETATIDQSMIWRGDNHAPALLAFLAEVRRQKPGVREGTVLPSQGLEKL